MHLERFEICILKLVKNINISKTSIPIELKFCVCVPMPTQLHYYALGVPHQVDRLH